MSSLGGRLGAVFIVATAIACNTRPLDPRIGQAAQMPPLDAAADVSPRDAETDVQVRDTSGGVDEPHVVDVPLIDLRPEDGPPGGGDTGADAVRDAGADSVRDTGGVPDAARDGAQRVRMLSLVLDGAPWYATQSTQGIAVDPLGRVYVGDYANVFAVDGATVTPYLTPADVDGAGLGDFDIGPDGRLYIVTSSGPGGRLTVVRSSQPHQAERWLDLSPTLTEVANIAVIDDGIIGVISRTGFWTFSDGGSKLVYDQSPLSGLNRCACEDLAAARSGVFLYQPGCNGSPMVRGRADGSGVGVLYNTAITQASVVPASNFTCVARDPSGGFYFIAQNVSDGAPRLYHVAEDAQGTSGLTWIETAPSFAEAKKLASSVFGFSYCSLATADDGTVYFQTYAQLWKVSP